MDLRPGTGGRPYAGAAIGSDGVHGSELSRNDATSRELNGVRLDAKYATDRLSSQRVARVGLWREEPNLVFLFGFLFYALLGWAGAYLVETYNWDGVTRIAQAHGVVFSRDPHLAALGFIWPPLPALADLPLVVLLKPLGLVLLAGPMMSSIYGAFGLAMLWVILRRLGLPLHWRLLWVSFFGVHKLVLHNSTMGLSEAPFMAFLLLSLYGFVVWEQEQQSGGLVWAGLGAAMAVYCRYEAVAWAAVVVVAIIWRLLVQTRKLWTQTASGSVIAFITPPVWMLSLWVLFNWQITGNPIYFLVGPGSTATTPDTAHIVGPSHPFFYAQGSVVGSLSLVLSQLVELGPLLLPASILLVLIVFRTRRWDNLAYLALGWSIVGFTFLIALQGALPPWTRYFFWIIPGGVIVAASAYRICPPSRWRELMAFAVALLLFGQAAVLHFQAWPKLEQLPLLQRVVATLVVAPEAAHYAGTGDQLDEFVAIADYLDAQPPGRLTLIDASVGSGIVFFLDRPWDLAITTDADFFPILRSPVGRARQVLVPLPTFDSRGRSEILKEYPNIYEGSEHWTRLSHEFSGPGAWRLLEIVDP